MHYTGVAPQAQVKHKNVALVTQVKDGDFNKADCFFAVSHKCKEDVFSKKELVQNYDRLMTSALKQSLALSVSSKEVPATGWAIDTQVETAPGSHHEVVVHYDLGHTIGMSLIPVVGLFTPHYYTMDVALVDKITIYHNRAAVWHEDIPVQVKKHISGSRFKIGGAHSDAAYRVYRVTQTPAVSKTMVALDHAMIEAAHTD